MPTVTSCQDLIHSSAIVVCGLRGISRHSAPAIWMRTAFPPVPRKWRILRGLLDVAEKQLDRPAALVGVGNRWAGASASLLRVRRSLPPSIFTCTSRTGLPNGLREGGSGSARARVVGSGWTPVLVWTADERLGCAEGRPASLAKNSRRTPRSYRVGGSMPSEIAVVFYSVSVILTMPFCGITKHLISLVGTGIAENPAV